MHFESFDEVSVFLKDHCQEVPTWVGQARKHAKKLKALKTGEGFIDELIEKIEKIESDDRKTARKKYSKDIRDTFHRIFEPRSNVYSATGGSVQSNLSETKSERLSEILKNFKGNKSIKKYFSETFFELCDQDPNGLIYLEYKGDEKIYPTYKSINDIRYYKSHGQNLKILVFEPIQKIDDRGRVKSMLWRVVDDKKEWFVIQEGMNFTEDTEPNGQTKSFDHPFGVVPGIVLSDQIKTGTEIRYSYINPIEALAEEYARDKSVLTLYKFISGFPIQWRYIQECRSCQGRGHTGKTDEEGKPISCTSCGGKGRMGKNDVTDIIEVPLPIDTEDPKVAPDLAGFVSPDLKTWERMRTDQKEDEIRMEDTIWGTHKAREKNNETATGKFIDVQPLINRLHVYADNAEWSINELIRLVINWMDSNPESKNKYTVTLGRNYIIESPDTILERYEDARTKGSNWAILDKLLFEFVNAKYKSDPVSMEYELKKIKLEPYVHISFLDANTIFGNVAAQKKELFGLFWQQAQKDKPIEELRTEMELFFNQRIERPATPEEPTQ